MTEDMTEIIEYDFYMLVLHSTPPHLQGEGVVYCIWESFCFFRVYFF